MAANITGTTCHQNRYFSVGHHVFSASADIVMLVFLLFFTTSLFVAGVYLVKTNLNQWLL